MITKAVFKGDHYTGFLRLEENIAFGDAETGKLKKDRMPNGDETRSSKSGVMPNDDPDYDGFVIRFTIPTRTMTA